MLKFLRNLLILILVAGALFYFFAPAEMKRNVLGDSILSSPAMQEAMPEAQIIASDVVARKNAMGTWIINGVVANQNDFAIDRLEMRFYFSDGFETRTINKVLNSKGLGKPFRIKIKGHDNAKYERFEVYKAR